MSENFWIVSRPKRKLVVIPEMLKVFATIAVGQQWSGNRELQRAFEKELVRFEWKAQNLSKDGSGSRTYAALLSLLGLWYEEGGVVHLTQAAKEIISGEPAVPQLTKQLINLQYPSPYSKAVHIDQSFKIQPHRFVIQLLSTIEGSSITQDELAYCVVPYARTKNDLTDCVARIGNFRVDPDKIKAEALNESGTSDDNLINIANTIINQLEYTGFFKYREEMNAPLEFDVGGQANAIKFIERYGRSLVTDISDKALYQKRFGSGINTTKDYTNTNPVQPSINPNDRAVLLTFYEVSQKTPIFGISEELVSKISQKTGVSPKQAKAVLTKIANQPLLDSFEERYINLSKGGNETATEFEKVTANVFGRDGFGLDAQWVGSRGAYPDIFVYIDKKSKIYGIVDTKAYKEYKLGIDQRNKMAHTYVPNFSKVSHESDEYDLGFFAYIAGGFGRNIQANFEKLRAATGSKSGCYITSYDFMQLLRRHKAYPYTTEQLIDIFTQDSQVIYDELART